MLDQHEPLRLISYLNLYLAPGLILFLLPNHYAGTISFQDIDNAVIFWEWCFREDSVQIIILSS